MDGKKESHYLLKFAADQDSMEKFLCSTLIQNGIRAEVVEVIT